MGCPTFLFFYQVDEFAIEFSLALGNISSQYASSEIQRTHITRGSDTAKTHVTRGSNTANTHVAHGSDTANIHVKRGSGYKLLELQRVF